MQYKYTGRAAEFRIPSDPKVYKYGDIVPISKQDALHMADYSTLHSFEEVKSGVDLMDKETSPIEKKGDK